MAPARRWLLAVGALLACALPCLAQAYEVTVDAEPFLKDPAGRRLADLVQGTRITRVSSDGTWARVTIGGWVPAASVGSVDREGHNAIINRSGGESLLARPGGASVARLLNGFLLDRIEESDGWVRVERSGWVRDASLRSVSGAAPGGLLPGVRDSVPAERPPALVSPGRRLMTEGEPIDLHTAPGADTIAVVRPGTPITVVGRANGWTRVRIEGWVQSGRLVTTDPDSVVAEVSAAELKANPEEYQGMRVRWTVQFIALEAAEPERTDFYEGEPFMQVRAPDPADGFVYIAVPPELLSGARALAPLETIEIVAQVRIGRSALMGVPILDLLALF